MFADYATTPGVPGGWVSWVSGATGVRVAGQVSPYGYQLAGPAGADSGIQQSDAQAAALGAINSGAWFVLEADVTLVSGALTGAGVRLAGRDASSALTAETADIVFSTDKDSTDAVVGAGVVGKTYRFRKLVQLNHASTAKATLYARSHSSALGSNAAANLLTWHRCSVRAATSAEIAAQRADTNASSALSQIATETSTRASADSALSGQITTLTSTVNGNSASISTHASALADINGRLLSTWGVTLNAGNRVSGLRYQQESGGSTTLTTFDVEADKFRIWNGTGAVPAFEVAGGAAYIAGERVRTESIVLEGVNKITRVSANLGGQSTSGADFRVSSDPAKGLFRKLIETTITKAADSDLLIIVDIERHNSGTSTAQYQLFLNVNGNVETVGSGNSPTFTSGGGTAGYRIARSTGGIKFLDAMSFRISTSETTAKLTLTGNADNGSSTWAGQINMHIWEIKR